MKCWKNHADDSRPHWIGLILLLWLWLIPVSVFAESGSYTMSLRASSETVEPGELIQLTVQVHNDGWPQSGDAEVAAFQAKLEYDRGSLEYVSVDIPEGTMGDFSPESGRILGYGEGHRFQETLDCAVLTMKVAEDAAGEIPVTISDVVLGRQDAMELKAQAAGTLTLRVGEASSVENSGSVSDPGAGNTEGGRTAAGNNTSAAGNNAASAGDNANGAGEDTSVNGGESTASSGGNGGTGLSESAAASSENSEGASAPEAANQKEGEEDVADPSLENAGEDSSAAAVEKETADHSNSGNRQGTVWLWIVLPAAAAIAAMFLWIRRRHRG